MVRLGFITAALAATAFAVPSPALKRATCTAGDTSTTDGVQAILDSTGAIDWLDLMLGSFTDGENNWVTALWQESFPGQGASPLTGCGDIGGDCAPDSLCSNYPSEMAYWVFRSVGNLHSKINSVRQQLLWTGWLNGLSIDQIHDDFTAVNPEPSWLQWVSAAFTMAGGVATGIDLSKPLRGMIGFASGAFNEIYNQGSSNVQVDVTSVENTLRNIVGAAGNYVATVLTNATGNGDPETLPIYTYTALQHATARFFDDNTILLDEKKDNSSFISAYSHFANTVEKKLVDVSMKTAYHILFADQNLAQSDCNMKGAYWLQAKPGEYFCFYLIRATAGAQCSNNDSTSCKFYDSPYGPRWDTGVYDKLTNTYGFDLQVYYTSLIDCYLNGKDQVDLTATTNDGQIPRCFYSLKLTNLQRNLHLP
ncbi:conserved hypothetical protein [Talaromyces stipitatus ATCC 10500]|uniref:Uncharacterized protein n=1 Tax=Talaromyces stipitatus (strain ATCC 10500 / CBS 375.48 / QM 6759 / NRRL 1006) TaxID=441959 RepID=B8MKH9_TALSN|nr:uncharacterized protein TSTA_047800 [Talaromyces stipitatus ATCC 10500]EED15334.1 conserved hypothetical protein [Talaromyces stipitatus ATCC 10500]